MIKGLATEIELVADAIYSQNAIRSRQLSDIASRVAKLEMAHAPEAHAWTEIKDRLPPELTEVLVDHIIDDHKHTIDIAWQKGGEWTFPWIGRLAKEQCAPVWVVRWTPLPPLPQRVPE